jgi:hypothetical protein
MKRSLVLLSLLSVLMVGFWSVSAAPANFAGTWALDKAKSEGLQGGMANLDQTWVVAQDAKTFTVEASFSGGEQPRPPVKRSYNLDGSETTQEMTGRMSGKAALKAKWQGESILELSSVLKTNAQGTDITITTTEHWELADGGKTLKVHRTQETPRGTQETKLTFAKK